MEAKAKRIIRLPQIEPLHYQYPAWRANSSGCQYSLLSYHRRGGKDLVHLSMLSLMAIAKRGIYHYMLPTRKWASRVVWDAQIDVTDYAGNHRSGALLDVIFPKEIVKRKNSTDYFIELVNGSVIFLGGTDGGDFVGATSSGIVLSEFSLHKPDVIGYVMPIIKQNDAFLWMNGTMRGKNNQLYDMMERNRNDPAWYTSWLKPTDTKLYCWCSPEYDINPELLPFVNNPKYLNVQNRTFYNVQDLIDSGVMSQSLARQEFLNDAVSHVTNSYYGYEMERVEYADLDPRSQPVYTFWDLGGVGESSDETCITFAQADIVAGRLKVVDYYENRGKKRGHYWEYLQGLGYQYGGHFFPHDGKRRNEYTGESSGDTAERIYGEKVRYVPKTQFTANDIEIVRRTLPKIIFDKTRTSKLTQALGNYHERESTGKPCHSNTCMQCGGASHAADSFRVMVMAKHLNLIEPYLLAEVMTQKHFWGEMREEADEVLYEEFVV